MIRIQATITGYGGRPCSLFSAYDTETRVLIVGAEAEYRRERRDGCVVIANDSALPRDALFTDADMMASIKAYYALKAGVAMDGKSPRLAFSERAARANPDQAIETDGMDATGPLYRVADGVTCAHIAALATCLHATRAETVESVLSMADQLLALSRGQILTI